MRWQEQKVEISQNAHKQLPVIYPAEHTNFDTFPLGVGLDNSF